MKSARFLLVVLLSMWGGAGLVGCAYRVLPEKTFRVTGYVLDAASRKPIPKVWVEDILRLGGSFAQTDSSGHFVMLLSNHKEKVRQLVVKTVLYEGVVTVAADTAQHVTILVHRNAFRFKPYGCQLPADSARIPRYEGSIQGFPGSQFAFLLRDSTNRQARRLRTITFTTGPSGIPREPFKFRIYPYGNQSIAPAGTNLLPEALYIFSQEGTFSYDVSAYNIVVPGSGFYLTIEYFVGCDHCPSLSPLLNYGPTGPVLRPPCARADIRTWEYTIDKGWQRATAVENCWPLYESAISVEVEPAPAKR